MKFEKDDIKIIILAAVGAFIGLGIYHLLFPPDKPPEPHKNDVKPAPGIITITPTLRDTTAPQPDTPHSNTEDEAYHNAMAPSVPQPVTLQSNPEDEAYLKAMAPSGTVADCKNFLDNYPPDANKPKRKDYRQKVATKLVAIAQDTDLDTASRITACNTYLSHFAKGTNSKTIKDIKKGLTSKSTQSTEEKKNTYVKAETKTVIDSYDKLFSIARNYNAMNMGWGNFQKKYEIKGSTDLKNTAKKLCDAIHWINKSKYDNAYKDANNRNTHAKEKVEILISNLNELSNK